MTTMARLKTLCIYHAECTDGAAAAAVVCLKYPGTILAPTKHGELPPENVKGGRVFIVDFSFSAQVLEKISREAAEFHWYDHHKTAVPIQKEIGKGIVDLKESGATLTWKQLFPKKKLPRILQYVRDKDLWLWKLPESRDFSAAMDESDGLFDPKGRLWKKFLKGLPAREWKSMIAQGSRSRHVWRRRIEKAAARGFAVDIEGVRVWAVNWSEDASDLGEYIYKVMKYPVALIFSYKKKEWTYSLRSATVDVADMAARFGGGGHAGAAGFRTADINWLFESGRKVRSV